LPATLKSESIDPNIRENVADKVKGLFIPLVILMFQKKDGGISVVAKNVPQSERFFDNHCNSKRFNVPIHTAIS
jgi:hypothetical protein